MRAATADLFVKLQDPACIKSWWLSSLRTAGHSRKFSTLPLAFLGCICKNATLSVREHLQIECCHITCLKVMLVEDVGDLYPALLFFFFNYCAGQKYMVQTVLIKAHSAFLITWGAGTVSSITFHLPSSSIDEMGNALLRSINKCSGSVTLQYK